MRRSSGVRFCARLEAVDRRRAVASLLVDLRLFAERLGGDDVVGRSRGVLGEESRERLLLDPRRAGAPPAPRGRARRRGPARARRGMPLGRRRVAERAAEQLGAPPLERRERRGPLALPARRRRPRRRMLGELLASPSRDRIVSSASRARRRTGPSSRRACKLSSALAGSYARPEASRARLRWRALTAGCVAGRSRARERGRSRWTTPSESPAASRKRATSSASAASSGKSSRTCWTHSAAAPGRDELLLEDVRPLEEERPPRLGRFRRGPCAAREPARAPRARRARRAAGPARRARRRGPR